MPPREPQDRDIDELYGLGPVFEPGAGDSGELSGFVSVQCPYCGERFETAVNLSAGSFSYIEDYQVCCQPSPVVLLKPELGRRDRSVRFDWAVAREPAVLQEPAHGGVGRELEVAVQISGLDPRLERRDQVAKCQKLDDSLDLAAAYERQREFLELAELDLASTRQRYSTALLMAFRPWVFSLVAVRRRAQAGESRARRTYVGRSVRSSKA